MPASILPVCVLFSQCVFYSPSVCSILPVCVLFSQCVFYSPSVCLCITTCICRCAFGRPLQPASQFRRSAASRQVKEALVTSGCVSTNIPTHMYRTCSTS
eukprot:scpid40654/ scgid16449/ 